KGASALWGLPALAGALSHLALDAATKTGVEPFAPLPLPGRLAFLAHPHGPLRTGTWWQEIPVMVGFAALALAALKL
ncbi:MAG: metal-dependent hydrolase, partial [Firmicutes bacterium]|nr:metal-dependent hydrolase [Bacillota bacterium]